MKRWISGVIIILSVILISVSFYSLMEIYQEDKESAEAFDSIRQIYEEADSTEEEDDSQNIVEINPGLLALHEQNSDCIGWIKIEGTAID